ncbi:hypothetical protein C8J57DRAFT_1263090 [Mycena rebaudengoi]|nr:hypothetical protein C8J57DRAFT_1263090 [Mycena rebaudengoi]
MPGDTPSDALTPTPPDDARLTLQHLVPVNTRLRTPADMQPSAYLLHFFYAYAILKQWNGAGSKASAEGLTIDVGRHGSDAGAALPSREPLRRREASERVSEWLNDRAQSNGIYIFMSSSGQAAVYPNVRLCGSYRRGEKTSAHRRRVGSCQNHNGYIMIMSPAEPPEHAHTQCCEHVRLPRESSDKRNNWVCGFVAIKLSIGESPSGFLPTWGRRHCAGILPVIL